MNIWHDINPDRITPNDFMAVIEIEKGSKDASRFLHQRDRRGGEDDR